MMGEGLRFLVGTGTERDIRDHLLACDAQFRPRLSDRVDIGEYARKVAELALTIEAWNGTLLVGLVAAYVATNGESCYITNVSVLPGFTGRGIATRLLRNLVTDPACRDVTAILLEVSKQSVEASRLYFSVGFRPASESGDRVLMQYVRNRGDDQVPEGPKA